MKSKVTVITVCRNCENLITSTIQSVLSQSYINIEYILIDGLSTDDTYNIAKSFKNKFISNGLDFQCISEEDNGIYDAMNKAIRMATGEWMIFMNSGDVFYNNLVIEDVFRQDFDQDAYIIYGNTLAKNSKEIIYVPKERIDSNFFFFNTICHQSIFFNKKVFNEIGYYNLDYKIISDRDLLFRIANYNGKFYHLKCVISIWDEEGFSKDNRSLFGKEEDLFKMQNFPKARRVYLLFFKRLGNLLNKTLQIH